LQICLFWGDYEGNLEDSLLRSEKLFWFSRKKRLIIDQPLFYQSIIRKIKATL